MNLLPSSFIRKVIVPLAALLAVLVGLYVLRDIWFPALLRQTVDLVALNRLGQHVSVGRISGDYLATLVLEDISSAPSPAPGTLVNVKVRRLEARYRLADLLRGPQAFLSNFTLLASAPEVVIATADQAKSNASAQHFALPDWLPALQVEDGAISWRHGNIIVESRGVALLVTRPDDRQQPYQLNLAMSALQLTTPSVTWAGPMTAKATASATAITVQELKLGDDLQVHSAHLQWPGTARGNAALAVELTIFDGQIKGSGSGQGELWEGNLALTNINLAKLAGRLPPLLQSGILTGNGHFRGDLARSQTWEATTEFSLDHGPEKLSLKASLAADSLQVERLTAELGANQLLVEQTSLPLPALRDLKWRALLQEAAGRFALRLNDIPALLGRLLPTSLPAPAAGGYPPHRLLATGHFKDAQALVEQFELTTAHNSVLGKDIACKLPADQHASMLDATIQAEVQTQIDDLGELAALFGQQSMAGKLQGRLNVTGPLHSLTGELDLEGSGLELHGVAIDTMAVQAHGDLNGVRISDCRLIRGQDQLTLQGAFDRKTKKLSDLDLNLRLTDLAAYSAIAPWLRNSKGGLQATMQGDGPLAAPQLKLDLATQDLTFHGHPLGTLRLAANTIAKDVLAYTATVEHQPMALRTTGEVALDRQKSMVTIALQTFALGGRQPWLDLAQPASCTVSWAKGARIAVAQLLLTGPAGALTVDGTAGVQDDNLLQVTVKDLRGDEWLALLDERLRLEGGNLAAELRGSWQAPVLQVSGSVAQFGEKQRDVALSADFAFNLGLDTIALQRCQLGDGHGSSLRLAGTLPANLLRHRASPQNRWDLTAEIMLADLRVLSPLLPATLSLQGAMQGEAQLTGAWQSPSGRLHLTGTGLRPHDVLPQAPPGLFTAEVEVTLDKDRLHFDPLTLAGENLNLLCQGDILGLPRWSEITAGTADWSGSSLNLLGNFTVPDLGWLATDEHWLRAVKGQLQGDVTMTGPLTQPVLGGQVQLSGGELRFDVAMPPFKNVEAVAALDGRLIRFQQISGTLGGAPFQGNGQLDFAPADGPRLVLDLKGKDLLFYRQEGLKVRADADLHAQGPLARLEISGDLAMADGQWTRNFNFLSLLPGRAAPGVAHDLPLFSLRKYPWNAMQFKVRGITRNPFQVRNNIVRGTLRPDLMLSGTGEAPILTGVVYIDPSRIDMPAGKIMLNSGVLHFSEKAPTRPDLEAVGQTRMMGYDINLTVAGTTAEPVVTLTSTPPLPEDQLLLLLLAGQAPQAGAASAGGRRQGVMTAAVYLGQGFLARILGGQAGESKESVLERFELAVGRDVSRKGDETLDAQFRLLDLREKGAGNMYLTGGRDMYDYFNLGLKIVFRFQ